MKKFRILGILAILVIVGDFAISFTAGWQEERDSFLAGSKSARAETPALYTPEVSLWRYDSGNNNIGFIA